MTAYVSVKADDILKRFEWLYSSNLQVQKDTKKLVRSALSGAKKDITAAARNAITSDPRKATKAVRFGVYKKIIGGQVNILDKRGGVAKTREWNPQRKLVEGQWGGNRRERSARTQQMSDYWGESRGFALRFLNSGTTNRTTIYGKRGHITAGNWFTPASARALEKAASELRVLIERAISEIWGH